MTANTFGNKLKIENVSQGDSGGGLMVRGLLAGIVSRGGANNCAKVGHLTNIILVNNYICQD